jgi:anti-sigma-K factor RskA
VSETSEKARHLEPWRVILVVGSCVAALLAGYAIYYGTQTHSGLPVATPCTATQNALHPTTCALYGKVTVAQVHNDANPWWLAAGLVEALVVVVAFGVGVGAASR